MLDVAIKQLRYTGTALAEATREYKIAVNKKALELRSSGNAVGMITLTIYGYEDIATLRFTRDTAEVVHQANIHSINGIKLQMRILEETIKREWGNIK